MELTAEESTEAMPNKLGPAGTDSYSSGAPNLCTSIQPPIRQKPWEMTTHEGSKHIYEKFRIRLPNRLFLRLAGEERHGDEFCEKYVYTSAQRS